MHTLLVITLLAAIDLPGAQKAASELEQMCATDAGRLWGRNLCGPIAFVDPGTREAVRIADGRVTETSVPASIGIANTAVEWDGRRWTMLMWPLPSSLISRRAILAHESFHRIQNELDLPQSDPTNAHLDSEEGRYWLRLEMRALARALATREPHAIEDALAFRARRHALFPDAAGNERLLEMNEGLAEHTGFALAIPHLEERFAPLVRRLAESDASENFVRSFAYTTGPAWGALIEARNRRWTREVKPADDLALIARRVWKLQAPGDAERRAAAYGERAVRAEEGERARRNTAEREALRATFVNGPVLIIPLAEMQFTFDPSNIRPLDDVGSIYRTMELRDRWGSIKVAGGALLTADYRKLIVPAGGDGYTLSLADGWEIKPGARAGDQIVTPSK